MGSDSVPGPLRDFDGAFTGGTVRATWRLSVTGESEAVSEPAAVRTTADSASVTTDQGFVSDLPGTLLDRLDVTAGTKGGRLEGR
jgi:hypothetical protein